MAHAEFYHDPIKNEGVLTFHIPDNEVQGTHIDGLSRLVIKMNSEVGTLPAIALSLLIILEAIEVTKEKERKDAARQN